MNILMMSNTYTPIVGGLERSIRTFTEEYRRRGHRVIIVAPVCGNAPFAEKDVIRVPAVQHFNGTDFSVQIPIPWFLQEALKDFRPDIVHAHHPFLIGDTALRAAYQFNVPLVYTSHTLFEHNTHYVPGDSPKLKRFAVQLSSGYANLADLVFAPSEGIRTMLERQGVRSSITVVPTGVDLSCFSQGNPGQLRERFGVPRSALVVGYVGRLAPEKNLEFLSRAVALFMRGNAGARFMVVGKGPSERAIREIFGREGLEERIHFTGTLENDALIDAYLAMDVFAFASQSETQGMSLVEAMAAGVPVVAVDAMGIHGLVTDGKSGILLDREDETAFARALDLIGGLSSKEKEGMNMAARETAKRYSKESCAERALASYEALTRSATGRRARGTVWGNSLWAQTLGPLRAEWDLIKNVTKAAASAVKGSADVP